MAFLAVVDACALYPFALRDTLLRLAELELYDVQWSDRILEEMRANLVEQYGATDEQADRIVAAMTGAFAGATVPDDVIARLEPAMTNDEKDRHVLAAAVASGAEVVVTFNLSDFPEEALAPLGVEAVHPDDFLQTLLAIDEPAVLGRWSSKRPTSSTHRGRSTNSWKPSSGGRQDSLPPYARRSRDTEARSRKRRNLALRWAGSFASITRSSAPFESSCGMYAG